MLSFLWSSRLKNFILNMEKVVLILSTMVDRQSDSEVNSSISFIHSPILRISGLGIFAGNCWLMTIYYQLLGAKIVRDVHEYHSIEQTIRS
jgi:hypothetical protein